MKVVQIVESLSFGDAVANDAVIIDQLLKKMGVCGGIYVTNSSNIDARYHHKIAETIQRLPVLEKDDVMLFHHAICNNFCDLIDQYLCHKIMIYHNITPPEFFSEIDEGLYQATKLGLEQTKRMRNTFECCIAVSEYNRQNLIDMGYRCPIFVCPILIPFRDYDQKPNPDIIKQYKNDGWVNILFVGRLSPQKKQQDLMKTYAIYKKYYNQKSRLFLVGSDGMLPYAKLLREYAGQLGVSEIYFTGSIPFADILAYYSVANVFLCMSEHEGFCVPLLEAMYFDLPVIACKSTAITETMGSAGILLDKKDFKIAAGWIHQLQQNKDLKEELQNEQWDHLQKFMYENVAKRMRQILQPYIPENQPPAAVKKEFIPSPESTQKFSLVMPIKESDWATAQRTVSYIQKYIRPQKIVIVSSSELLEIFPNSNYITCMDEDKLLPGLNINNVRRTLRKAGGNPQVAGWYLQQFIKLGYSRVTDDSCYLVWDADTIPLTEIDFFEKNTGKPYFNLKREYVAEYFKTIKNLLGLEKARNESFITEHMIFDTMLCRGMLDKIESDSSLPGTSFWEKCVYASRYKNSDKSFSEYETYGTYVSWNYPDAYKVRKLRTLRSGQIFLGKSPSDAILDWAGNDFDTVSFEHFDTIHESGYAKFYRDSSILRKKSSCASVIRRACNIAKFFSIVGGSNAKDYYRELTLKLDFDFFFGDGTVYERKNKA